MTDAPCVFRLGPPSEDLDALAAFLRAAPRAEVVVMPMAASSPFGAMGPHISVTIAGKWAVMKAS